MVDQVVKTQPKYNRNSFSALGQTKDQAHSHIETEQSREPNSTSKSQFGFTGLVEGFLEKVGSKYPSSFS